MADYKNVIYSFVSYRRNIKDMPFVNKLGDTELAFGVARSLNEIFNEEFEFKSLKNLSLVECKQLQEKGIITKELIENKDISSYAVSYDETCKIFVNECDHIRLISCMKGFELEKCFECANGLDDVVLDKLEMEFDTYLGYLTANPNMCGTGIEVGVLLFIPALWFSKKLMGIKDELLKNEYAFYDISGEEWQGNSAFVFVKNIHTFGHKENEFAERLQVITDKIIKLEKLEEENIFNLSASSLVDDIFRSYGILQNSYRISFDEAIEHLTKALWGINLNVLKYKKGGSDILKIASEISENHVKQNKNMNIKEQDKLRSKLLCGYMTEFIEKGEVDV